MDRELEIAGAASAGGWMRWRKQHATRPPGSPCANCETVLQGPYCFNCGQLAEDFDRSIWALVVEGVESLLHLDGRLWRTLPDLALKPGKLTHDYLQGRRANQIPPFRLFLVTLLIVFFAGGLNLGGKTEVRTVQLRPDKETSRNFALGPDGVHVTTKSDAQPVKSGVSINVKGDKDRDSAACDASQPSSAGASAKPIPRSALSLWIHDRACAAAKDPELFVMVLESWGHRFAILMLPIAALMLSVLFVFQRRFFVFDHLIFAMHSLSFQGLLLTPVLALMSVAPLVGWLLLVSPVHLFVHMRGTYRTSILGTLLRMALLFIGTAIAVLFLVTGLLLVGLNALRPH